MKSLHEGRLANLTVTPPRLIPQCLVADENYDMENARGCIDYFRIAHESISCMPWGNFPFGEIVSVQLGDSRVGVFGVWGERS